MGVMDHVTILSLPKKGTLTGSGQERGLSASSLDANRVPRPFSPAHQAISPTKAYLPTVLPPYKITTINFDFQRSRVTRFSKVMIMFE